jgi:hypothetical protein
MANYRSLHVKIWSDPDFESYSPKAKLLFIYLVTCPHRNESGLYSISLAKIAFECGMTAAEVEKSMAELSTRGKVMYDSATSVVWVVNAVRYQSINANCVTSIASDVGRCSSRTLAIRFCQYYSDFDPLTTHCNGFLNLWQTHPNGLTNPPIGTGTGLGTGTGEDAGAGNSTDPPPPSKPVSEFEQAVAMLRIPPALDTEEFHELWPKWLAARRANVKPKIGWQKLFQGQLDLLATYTPQQVKQVLTKSTVNGYQGLVEPSPTHRSQQPAKSLGV